MFFITVIDEQAEILMQSICTPACKHQGVNSRLVAIGQAATFCKQQGQTKLSTLPTAMWRKK